MWAVGLSFGVGLAVAAATASGEDLPRLKHNQPGLVVDLGVGLWATPMPMDYDGDGDLDLLVVCPDKPYNGIYFFENPGGSKKMPVFRPGRRITRGMQNFQVSYVDGRARVLRPGEEYVDFPAEGLSRRVKLPVSAEKTPAAKRIRANQWRYVDYDGDGAQDLIIGVEDWGDYGWEDAYDATGRWTNGPLHGFVYLLKNTGTNGKPAYASPVKVEAGGRAVDTFGMPSPCFADFDGDDDLDLICGEFRDGLTYFRNVGTRQQPRYEAGRPVASPAGDVCMDLCMIVPVAIDWDGDGDVDVIVGQEDGRVALVENTGRLSDGRPLFEPPRFFQQEADEVKFGALVTPVAFDWDADGDVDLLAGNTAGYIGFIENLGGQPMRWAAPRYLEVDGRPIRIMAGESGSIQGPAEAKWGYTTISVADWDHDGRPDIVANSIWGKVVWFRNVGTRKEPRLAAAAPIEVDWSQETSPKPPWNWWTPAPRELVTQWRTTPVVVDLDADGLNDLVMLDSQGFLSFFRRERKDGALHLLPGRRVFRLEEGTASAFDANHKAVAAELAKPDAEGRVQFLHTVPGVTRSALDTSAVQTGEGAGAGQREPRLRLNSGWAGRSGRRKLCMADLDGDGRLDLLVNSTNTNWLRDVSPPGARDVWTFQDVGSIAETVLAGHDTSPTVMDLDGDGKLDVLIGAEDGHLYCCLQAGKGAWRSTSSAPAGTAKE